MKIVKTLTAGLCAVSLSSAWAGPSAPPAPLEAAVEEATSLGVNVSVGYDSEYIFRGVKFADDSVWAQVDYAYDLTENLAFDIGAWYETSASDQYDELNLWAGLSTSLGPIDLSAGFLWYYFPPVGTGASSDTQEVFYSLGYDLYGFTLGFTHAYDFVPEGHYFQLAVGRSIALTEALSLDLSAGISYNYDYFLDGNGWNNVDLSAGLPIALSDSATLTPYIAYSHALDVLEDSGVDDYFYGGVSLSVSF